MTLRRIAAVAALAASLAGCSTESPPAPAGVIDRAAFVSTFAELRDAAMKQPLKILADEDRARILSAHGVTEAQLIEFTEAWGADPDYMTKVWDDVRSRMQPLAPPDTTVR
jgi:hypothetical protein